MTNEQYHADVSHISKSGLDLIAKSPAHYYAKYLDPSAEKQEPTEAMRFGTALHAAILEPNVFNLTYYVLDDRQKIKEIGGAKPRATTKYKEWREEQAAIYSGRTELAIEDYDTCMRMQESVRKHPAAKLLLEKGTSEQSFFWKDQETGAPCKMRTDWISESTGHIVDLKSTEDASPEGFAKSVGKYRYHVQAPFYVDGFTDHFKHAPEQFSFIAVEKEPPYAVGVYYVPNEIYLIGQRIYQENLQSYMQAKRSGLWESYSEDFMPLQLPSYILNKYKNK